MAVSVVTYRRPEGLERLLRGLDRLVFTENQSPDIRVIVVDNDDEGTGRAVCERLRRDLRWPLLVEMEPRRGISFARNRALGLARATAEFIAFIDDDEEPDPRWLNELLRTQAAYQADIVTGPVVPRFAVPPPSWVKRGRFFERARFPTGTRVRDARTGNVLFRVELAERLRLRFNEGLALTGGEDTHFFRQLLLGGACIVFSNEAIVYEWVPPSRATARWLLQRHFRLGNALALIDRDVVRTPQALLIRAGKALGRIALGACALPLAILSGSNARAAALRALTWVWRGAGMFAGLCGFRYEEYRNVHGS